MYYIYIAIVLIILIFIMLSKYSQHPPVSKFYPNTDNGLMTSYDLFPDRGGSIFSHP